MNVCTKCGEFIYIGPRGCWCTRQARREREEKAFQESLEKIDEYIKEHPEIMDDIKQWVKNTSEFKAE